MKIIKSSLTRLINKIQDSLPDENDIYGYAGITKSGIVDSLKESYNLLDELEKRKETFEVILLKRSASELIQNANDFLNDQLKSDQIESKFNKFLKIIANIKYQIKETYLLVVEDSIRSESRIIELKRSLTSLEEILSDFEELKTKTNEEYSAINGMIAEISAFYDDIDEKQASTSTASNSAQTNAIATSKHLEESNQIVASLKKILDTIETKERSYKTSLSKFNKLHVELSETGDLIKNYQASLENQLETAKTQQQEIQQIIENANRASMAGSFKTRKEELDKPIKTAEKIMNITLIAIASISGILLWLSGIGSENFDYVAYLSKMTVVAPLVWIAWSSSKKLGHLTRIREDYAFKFASAMAYEGYKQQANEVDPSLLKQLLATSIENMGVNPIRLFDAKNNHASPMHESADKAFSSAEKLVQNLPFTKAGSKESQ